jgi:hypothetical protein
MATTATRALIVRPGDPLSPIVFFDSTNGNNNDNKLHVVPTSRRYVTVARALPRIADLPARAPALVKLGMDPNDPDSKVSFFLKKRQRHQPKVPPPDKCKGKHMVAYSQCIYFPGVPMHLVFLTFPEYEG